MEGPPSSKNSASLDCCSNIGQKEALLNAKEICSIARGCCKQSLIQKSHCVFVGEGRNWKHSDLSKNKIDIIVHSKIPQ